MVRAAHQRSNRFYVGALGWLAACAWLVSQGLGILAVIFTSLLALWIFGLRDKFDSEEMPSAYSVFNKGGRSILGGFTGEQLEEQLRGGVGPSRGNMASDTKIKDDDAPLVSTTSTNVKTSRSNEKDRLKRRSAAAAGSRTPSS